jgi:protein SCO1/2
MSTTATRAHAVRLREWTRRHALATLARMTAVLAVLASSPAHAAITPRDVATIRLAAVPGTPIPGDAAFVDEHGRAVRLRDYLGRRPVLLVPGYYGCSNLCSLVLAGLQRSLAQAQLVPGRDAEVVVVSIAALETPAMAATRKRAVLGDADAPGWHFLTGAQPSIDRVTHAIGFSAVYDAASASYAHPTGIAVLGADGVLRTLLPGIDYPAPTLRQALVQAVGHSSGVPAAGGAVASAGGGSGALAGGPARWLLCLHDDITSGRYNAAAMTAARVVGLSCVAGLLFLMGRGGRREHERGTRA